MMIDKQDNEQKTSKTNRIEGSVNKVGRLKIKELGILQKRIVLGIVFYIGNQEDNILFCMNNIMLDHSHI